MATFLHSVASVAVVLLLTALGYYCSARGWIDNGAKTFITKYLIRLAVPLMCVHSMRSRLTREMIAESWRFLLVPLLAEALLFLLAWLLGRALRLPHRTLGVFVSMCALSNAVYIGYTMCVELFGEVSTPHVMLYYLVNTSLLNVVAMELIRRSGGAEEKQSLARSLLDVLRMPTFLGVLAGILLVLFDLHLSSFLMSTLSYVSASVSPLALLLTGHIIREIGLRGLKLDRPMLAVMLMRFLAAPLLTLALCIPFAVTGLGRSVLLVEMAMPTVTQIVVAASAYGADEDFAARGAAISTLACFVVTPVLMLLL